MAFGSQKKKPFTPQMASIYEAVHGRGVDYAARARMIATIAAERKKSPGSRLLDVACGTGSLLEQLQSDFVVEGLDSSKAMLDIARARLPGVRLYDADMSKLRTRNTYDVITCLGASLCYSQSVTELYATIGSMSKRLNSGGILIVDTWLQPDYYDVLADQGVWRIDIDQPERKISVLRRQERDGRQVVLEYHYLVGTIAGVSYFSERHRVSMFTPDENQNAFTRHGLQASIVPDPDGLFRGCIIYVGVKA